MHNDHYETLLARAVTKGALQHEQIGDILNFRLFGNKRGYLTLENLPVGDIPPTPPSREQLNKPDESSERLLLQATALLGEPIEEQAFFLTEPYNFLSDYGPTGKNQRIDINRHQTILYGDPDAPFFRFDPQFMLAFSSRAQQLMDKLRNIAWEVVEPVRLNRGDMLIIDNRRTAHARSPFSARFAGSDRWIQRAFAITNPNFYAERLGKRSRVFGLVTEL